MSEERQSALLLLLNEAQRDAVARLGEADLSGEVGILRYVLLKVLRELDDPAEQALAVARLAWTVSRVVLARERVGTAGELERALGEVLGELGLEE